MSTAVYYLVSNIIGYIFVNQVNLQGMRRNPFLDHHDHYNSFWITILLITPILYLFSSMYMFKFQSQLHGYWEEDMKIYEGRKLSKWECFKHNAFVWTTSYYVGLQFTHLDHGILQTFKLKWTTMQHWPYLLWLLFILLCFFLLCLTLHLLLLSKRHSLLTHHCTCLCCLLALCLVHPGGLRKAHIHHYLVALGVLALISYQINILVIVHGIFSGIFIEGVSRWGVDPIWY